MSTSIAALLVLLFLPLTVLLYVTASKQQHAKRLRHQRGLTYRQIGLQLGISPTTARKYALA